MTLLSTENWTTSVKWSTETNEHLKRATIFLESILKVYFWSTVEVYLKYTWSILIAYF